MIYYGDEIGMTHTFNIDKDGGFKRTGARTPMQWTNGKNRGFSLSDEELYLPVKNDKFVCVEEQEKDDNSLLNTVRELIKIRKENTCLHHSAGQEFVSKGYPCIIRRFNEQEEVIVCINPSNNSFDLKYANYDVLFSQNVEANKEDFKLKNQSILILKKKKS
jgi:maltose alpha-D-glucosyltransferase/alpha-amylase